MTETDSFEMPDVEAIQGARIYAEALWGLAHPAGQAEMILDELRSLVTDVLDPNQDLEVFFQLGSISRERRKEMIEHIFQGKASDLVYSFLLTLNERDRLGLLRPIVQALQQLDDASKGKAPVLVRTATPLPPDQLEAVRALVEQRFGVVPQLTAEVDPSLLGGLWLRVGDNVYDRSVRSSLERLKENILTRSSYEIQSG